MKLPEKHSIVLGILGIALLAGIIARLFGFFVLPESAYADSLFHLKVISESVISGHFPLFTIDVLTTPLYYWINWFFFTATGLQVSMPFFRILPFIFTILQGVLAFFLLSRLFKTRPVVLAGTAFIVAFPWLVMYSPVNYPENLASVLVLAFFYFLLRYSQEKNSWFALFSAILIPLIALAKFTTALLVPILAVALALIMLQNKESRLKTFLLCAASCIASAAWFVFSILYSPKTFGAAVIAVSKQTSLDVLQPLNLFHSFLSFFGFPAQASFSIFGLNSFWAFIAIAFFVLVLPLAFAIVHGARKNYGSLKVFYSATLLSVLLFFALAFRAGAEANGILYARYLIPVIPLIGVFFAKGFDSLRLEKSKKPLIVVAVSFLLFSGFSLAYSVVSATSHNEKLSEEIPLFEFIKGLPGTPKIASLSKHRQIQFYSGKDASKPLELREEITSSEVIYSALKSEGYSIVAVSCYNDLWRFEPSEEIREGNLSSPFDALKELESQGKFSSIFSQGCLEVFRVN